MSLPALRASLLLGLVACNSSVTELAVDSASIPEQVEWIAAYVEDGTMKASFPPTRRSEVGITIELGEGPWTDELQAELLGFRAGVLDAPIETLIKSPLTLATDGDPTLPTADWIAMARPLDKSIQLFQDPRTWTATWLPRCPKLLPTRVTGLVEQYCAGGTCPFHLAVEGCDLRISADCWGKDLHATISPAGQIIAEDDFESCDLHLNARGADLATECSPQFAGGCDYSFHFDPITPLLDMESWQVVDRPEVAGDQVTPGVARGSIAGLAAYSNQLAVGVRADGDLGDCESGGPSELRILDGASLELVRTATLPPCLGLLTQAEPSSNLVGAFTGPQPMVANINAAGEVTARWAISGKLSAVAATTSFVAVATLQSEGSTIQLARASDLEPTVTARFPGEQVVSLSTGGNFIAALARSQFDATAGSEMVVVDPSSGVVRRLTTISTHDGFSVYADNPTRRLVATGQLAASIHENLGFVFSDASTARRGAVYFEGNGIPHTLGPWTSDARYVAAGLLMRDGTARVALLDPTLPRFIPGGSIEVGRGVIGQVISTEFGTFVSLPWSGSVARVFTR